MPKRTKTPNAMLTNATVLEEAFYAALSSNDVEAMMQLWSDTEDVVCILPYLPYTQGHIEVRELWENLFTNGRFQAHILATHRFDNMLTAVHTLLVHIQLTRKDDPEAEPRSLNLHTTQVYLKSEQGWKLSVFHATVAQDNKLMDVLPELLH